MLRFAGHAGLPEYQVELTNSRKRVEDLRQSLPLTRSSLLHQAEVKETQQ